jgi:hypothetical protein
LLGVSQLGCFAAKLIHCGLQIASKGSNADATPIRGGAMALSLTHIAAVVAGLSIVVTGFTVSPRRGLLAGGAVAVAFGIFAALLITAIRSFAP